jgi:hypothetical protein
MTFRGDIWHSESFQRSLKTGVLIDTSVRPVNFFRIAREDKAFLSGKALELERHTMA